jgi:glycosyltransferase involved in cell wall biosynthesis
LAVLRANAAVVVVPSLFYEHFCYTAAEALLDARPVVAARIGAIPELVEHEVTGLLTPPGDAHALSESVVRALDDPEAANWAAAGRTRLLEASAPAAHVEGLTAIYREAMEPR